MLCGAKYQQSLMNPPETCIAKSMPYRSTHSMEQTVWILTNPIVASFNMHPLLAVRHTSAPSETLLAKVLAVGQKKSLEAAC